jgi:translation elongation factor EF-G
MKLAMRNARPVLLEPFMKVKLRLPKVMSAI